MPRDTGVIRRNETSYNFPNYTWATYVHSSALVFVAHNVILGPGRVPAVFRFLIRQTISFGGKIGYHWTYWRIKAEKYLSLIGEGGLGEGGLTKEQFEHYFPSTFCAQNQ